MAAIIAKKGDRGVKVKCVQRLLRVYADGMFGKLTEEAVKEFQKTNGLAVDGVVGLKTWQKLLGMLLLPSGRAITDIIIHCTATKEGQDYTVDQIRRWHKQRGFSDIGYHYVVHRNGKVEDGRSVDVAGAHCAGHNAHSIGVCYVGGLSLGGRGKDTRTLAQRAALLQLLKTLKKLYPSARIAGHRDYSPDKDGDGLVEPSEWIKECPCFDAKTEYASL